MKIFVVLRAVGTEVMLTCVLRIESSCPPLDMHMAAEIALELAMA